MTQQGKKISLIGLDGPIGVVPTKFIPSPETRRNSSSTIYANMGLTLSRTFKHKSSWQHLEVLIDE